MTTVGSLAYSIVASTQNFTAGVAASKAELRTLKDAFLAGQTPVERYSMAIEHLEQLAQKFPEKAEGVRRTIAKMREEMASGGGFHEGARGAGELSEGIERINSRMARMTISEVMGQIKQIPGLAIAVDVAFGNWIGAAIHAFELAHELMEETAEAVNKTADAYASATDKVIQFYEAEKHAKEKGRARDKLTDSGLSGDAEKSAAELGMGKLGYAASNTMAGRGQRAARWIGEFSGIFTGMGRLGEEHEKAIELGKKQINQEMESRRLAEDFAKDREKWLEEYERDFEKAGEDRKRIDDQWLENFMQGFDKAAEHQVKTELDAVNRIVEAQGKLYADNEKRADQIAKSHMNGAEKLREEFEKVQELEAGGFFDLHPGAHAEALNDLRDKASEMARGGDFKGITSAVTSASREGIAARFGMHNDTAQERRAKKAEEQRNGANVLLGKIEAAVRDIPAMGVMP